jgi:ribonuclease HII
MINGIMLLWSFSNLTEAGIDEAGRGCLAGPVVAAAVILPTDYQHKYLNDSKQLSAKQRETAAKDIILNAISYAYGIVEHHKIDEINILKASFLAMNIAVRKLIVKPEFLIIDGNRFVNETDIPFKCIIKGDATYRSIAAASILAKTYRDELMMHLDKEYPQYHWNKNKGYPTLAHRQALRQFGISPYHRKSFRLLNHDEQLLIDFNKTDAI